MKLKSKNGRMFAFAGLLVIAAPATSITSAARATTFITFTDDFSPQQSTFWSNSIGNWTSASGKYFAYGLNVPSWHHAGFPDPRIVVVIQTRPVASIMGLWGPAGLSHTSALPAVAYYSGRSDGNSVPCGTQAPVPRSR